VLGDALHLDAPFINFCLGHGKHAIATIRGDHRLLLQDAEGLFAQQTPDQWTEGNCHVQFWDVEGFTSAIARFGIRVLPITASLVSAAAAISQQHGLLSGDALALHRAGAHGADRVSSQELPVCRSQVPMASA
jgi:hypothetical protein